MSCRDRAQVEEWLADFWETHSLFRERLRILDDQFVPDHNSGVVIVALEDDPGVTYLSVEVVDGEPRWVVTFEIRAPRVQFDADGLNHVAGEIAALSTLCEYLQRRTDRSRAGLDRV